MTKIEQLRNDTYNEAIELLDTYGQCAIIRPTGFGKTGLLTRVIKSGKYKKMLYLYPAEVIKNTVLDFYHNVYVQEVLYEYYGDNKKDYIPNVTFMSYMKLTMLTEKDIKELTGTDLIICDECHRLGAAETMIGIDRLLSMNPKPHILGATATPERMDVIDELALFFDDHCTSPYTLHDAFQDGIIKKPYYVFCAYGESDPKVLAKIKHDATIQLDGMNDIDRKYATDVLDARVLEISRLTKMENVIKATIDETNIDPSYQKYIVFFKDYKHMDKSGKNIKKWFKNVFPKHTINELVVTAKCPESINELDNLTYKENTIDFIFACEMLNLGYHVKDITGIIMYRGTFSGTIYSQQLGRALSTGDSDRKIVFDIVDNLHRKSVYEILRDDENAQHLDLTEDEYNEYIELVKRTRDKNLDGTIIPLTADEKARLFELRSKVKKSRRKGISNCNDISSSDLICTKYSATYKELISKTVAEMISMRCRQAWNRWIEKGGDPGDMTREYIMGQKAPNYVPLAPFCKLKNVTIQAVLNEMKIA